MRWRASCEHGLLTVVLFVIGCECTGLSGDDETDLQNSPVLLRWSYTSEFTGKVS